MREWTWRSSINGIGVNGVPAARDEYDGYLGPLIEMLFDGAHSQDVARYLANVQTERMGLPASPGELRGVADRTVGWYASLRLDS